MRLAKPRQQFAHCQQLFLDAEAAMAAQPAEIRKAILHRRDPQIDKGVGFVQACGAREHLAIATVHRLAHLGHRLKPAVRAIIGDEAAIDTRHTGFLMFQQQVGHARISGYDEDAVVEIVAAAACDQDIVEQAGGSRHRRAADFLNAMQAAHAITSARSPWQTLIASASRAAMKDGRGFATPKGATSWLDIAL